MTFCAYLYAATQGGAAKENTPARMYNKYMKMHPGVKIEMVPEPPGT